LKGKYGAQKEIIIYHEGEKNEGTQKHLCLLNIKESPAGGGFEHREKGMKKSVWIPYLRMNSADLNTWQVKESL